MIPLPSYRFAENPFDDSMGAVKINNGKFKGFIYQYGVVTFGGMDESNNDDTPSLNFTYEIVDNPKGYPVNKELVDIMGGILFELIKERYDDGSDYREDYPKESDSE